MTENALWEAFCRAHPACRDASYEAWAFGGDPDELASLVLAGTKTATASAYDAYGPDEPLPQVGDYSVVLDSRGDARCVIRTTRVYLCPYEQVPAEHAWKEGEGDRSLAYWRKAHEAFFTEELAEVGLPFTEDRTVVCEEFTVVFSQTDV